MGVQLDKFKITSYMLIMRKLLAISILLSHFLRILVPGSIACAESLHCCCASDQSVTTQSSDCCQPDPVAKKHASCDKACSHETSEFYPQATHSAAISTFFVELKRYYDAKDGKVDRDRQLSLPPKVLSQSSTALAMCSRLSVWRL